MRLHHLSTTRTPTATIRSQTRIGSLRMEALRLQLDNLRVELHDLQLENARLKEPNPEAPAEIYARTEADRCGHESEQLTTEMVDLWKLLHESQEREARVVGRSYGGLE